MSRRIDGVGRDDAELLLAGKRFFADFVPALVELPFKAFDPAFGGVVRCVRGAGSEIDEKRLVRLGGFLCANPVDGPVRHVGHQVIAGIVGGLDPFCVLDQPGDHWFVSPPEKAVEVLKAQVRGPAIEGSRRPRFPVGRVVPFAECGRAVAVALEHLRDQARRSRATSSRNRESRWRIPRRCRHSIE